MSRKNVRKSDSLKDVKKLLKASGPVVPELVPSVEVPEAKLEVKEVSMTRANDEVKLEMKKVKKLRIRMMDDNQMGFAYLDRKCSYADGEWSSSQVKVELDDGLMMVLNPSEFIVVDEEEDRQLMSGKVSRVLAGEAKVSTPHGVTASGLSRGGELVFDLHLEAIPGGRAVPVGQQLDFQMEHFHAIMRENLCHRGLRFSIVHGVGDGILKSRIRKELDEVYALRCSYLPGHSGVTVITVK